VVTFFWWFQCQRRIKKTLETFHSIKVVPNFSCLQFFAFSFYLFISFPKISNCISMSVVFIYHLSMYYLSIYLSTIYLSIYHQSSFSINLSSIYLYLNLQRVSIIKLFNPDLIFTGDLFQFTPSKNPSVLLQSGLDFCKIAQSHHSEHSLYWFLIITVS
jgi:hypothetical protein